MSQERAIEDPLIARAIARDPDALGQLYDQYAVEVYDVARRITGSPEDAEDVTQTVFLGLPSALRSFTGRGSLKHWVRRVAATTALQFLRNRSRSTTLTEFVLARFASRKEERRILARLTVEQAVDSLPPDLRVVIVLKELEGYSHREIGALLQITPENSAVRLHRARKYLREWLVAKG